MSTFTTTICHKPYPNSGWIDWPVVLEYELDSNDQVEMLSIYADSDEADTNWLDSLPIAEVADAYQACIGHHENKEDDR
jgi:hypothetical protein